MKPQDPILVVDDSKKVLDMITSLLQKAGMANILTCHDSRQVKTIISDRQVSVLILDLLMPHISGEDLLESIGTSHPDIPVIMLTGSKDVQTAIRCMKTGAFDYVIKQLEMDRLKICVDHALKLRELRQENTVLRKRVRSQSLQNSEAFDKIITKNGTMLLIFQYAESIAQTSHPLLITGETGTGKELFAKAVHAASGRKGEIVIVNVAALDDNMFSDTIFGHAKGAFTDAVKIRRGLIEKAAQGTLFLDEIGDLSMQLQVKLLRFIQTGEYLPLGSDMYKKSDARIIAATNKDLYKLRAEGNFRDDLMYRLNTHNIRIPPLRERKSDILILLNHFLEKAALELNKKRPDVPAKLIPLLESYSFPGNVRELESMVFDAVSREKTGVLPLDMTKFAEPLQLSNENFKDLLTHSLKELPSLKEAGDMLVDEAMKRSLGNQTVAARMLGITQSALSVRLKKREQKNKSVWK